jgi:spoIIIJ-associated protein
VAEWDWVEAVGPSVEKAVQAAVEDLGLESPDHAEIEVIQEPKGGFLGIGGTDAIVRVRPKPKKSSRRRRRGGRGGRGRQKADDDGKQAQQPRRRSDRPKSGSGGSGGAGGSGRGAGGSNRQGGDRKREERRPRPQREPRQQERKAQKEPKEEQMEVEIDRDQQVELVKEFLTGLLDAFGLEGDVDCRLEDDMIIADVTGEQTEALVGPKGSILQATHELCRTIVQRKSQAGARLRLDIAGYQERRREALRIYTGRLVEKVIAEGGEIMLEPMNPAERKVVHDAAAEIGGVRTFSEGEEPHRSVVIAKDDED